MQNVALGIWSSTQKLPEEQRAALLAAIAGRSPRLNEYVTAFIAA